MTIEKNKPTMFVRFLTLLAFAATFLCFEVVAGTKAVSGHGDRGTGPLPVVNLVDADVDDFLAGGVSSSRFTTIADFADENVTLSRLIVPPSSALRLPQPTSDRVTTLRLTGSNTSRIDGSFYALGTVHIISSAPVVVGPNALVQVGRLSITAPRVEIEGRVLTTFGDVQIHGVEEVVVSGTIQTARKRFASIEIEGAAVAITGSLVAPGGVRVSLSGRAITLESALIDASGMSDGGTVTIGGKLLDGNFVSPAQRVLIDPETVIRADAGKSGNGGTVIVWSDENTYFAGSISCRGGADRGDGGFVEVSAKNRLAYVGQVDASATNGQSGTVLIDPFNLLVDVVGPDDPFVLDGTVAFDEPDPFTPATISAGAIETLPSTVILQATNDITVSAPVTFTAGNALAIEAGNDVSILSAISGASSLVLAADAGFVGFPSDGTGVVSVIPSLSATGTIEMDAGTEAIVFSESITGTGISVGSAVSFDSNIDQTLDAGTGSLTLAGPVTKSTTGTLTLRGTIVDLGGDVSVAGDLRVLDSTSVTITGSTVSGDLRLEGSATLDGVGSQSLETTAGSLTLEGSLDKTTAGDLTLTSATTITLDGDVTVSGGSLTVNGGATINGGIVSSTGDQLYIGNLTLGGDTMFSAPKVTIQSDLDLAPLLPTVTNIVTDLEFGTSASKVIFELGGTDAADHDRIIVGGNVTLDGTLEIRLINGFVPQACDSFEIITANSVVGIFIDVIPPDGFQVNCPPPGDCKIVEILPGSFPAVPWYEDFDDYDPGSGLHGGLGWKGWDDDPAFDAPITEAQANSGTNSVDISGDANIVHDICDIGSGAYTFSAWQYIPSDFVSGGGGALDGSYFILLNTYDPSGPDHYSVQLQFDSNDGLLKAWHGDGNNTINVPYETDRWVKIQTVVDLDNDWTQVYYDDNLITEYTWTGGILGDGGGALDIAVVDLYAKGSSIVYYDDLTIEYCVINDDFDLYANGSSLHDQGGWKGWDNDPAFSAPVTQDEARSGSQSVAIAGESDLVHESCTLQDGLYSFSAWQYIPADFASGGGGALDGTYFVLLNTYNDGGPYHWSTQLQFNSNDGLLHAWHGDGDHTINVPYDTDRWVKIQTVVDLEDDWTQVYYDDDLVTEYTWTGGILGDGGGALDIAAVDLFANDSSFVYYDDLFLQRCELDDDFEPFGLDDELHGLGGWKGWDDDPAFCAPITQDQAHRGAQAVDVSGSAHLLHEFCTRHEDVYTLSAWQYIPSDFVSGGAGDTAGSHFVIYNQYNDFGPVSESVRIQVDSTIASVRISQGEMNSIDVPYDTDRWVKIQTVVDLDNDWTRVYYDDELITEYTWTGGIIGSGGGALDIAAVDLFANGSTSIYYDDIRIERGCNLEDDFDFYFDDSQLHGQGGWKGRDNNPAATAPVTQDQARSAPQAADIFGDADLLHEFCTPEDGVYSFEAWQYIPADFASGGRVAADGSYFILLNTYADGVSFDPSVQLQADPNDGLLKVFHGDGSNTIDVPYKTDRWVKIQNIIDLDDDWTQIYYDDELITEYTWTGGILGDGGGALDIAAVDLFANGSTSVYYDDLRLDRGCGVGRNSDVDGDGSNVGEELVRGTDSCDPDTDDDGALDGSDNCPLEPNAGQEDCDSDGVGDLCTLSSGLFGDCDTNSVPDNCDVTAGAISFGSPISRGGGSGFLGTMISGHFNNDDHLDMAFGLKLNGGMVTVFGGAGDGSFPNSFLTVTTESPSLHAAADVNGDGFDDVIAIGVDEHIYVYFSNGDNTVVIPALELGALDGSAADLAAADMDRDGTIDLVVTAGDFENPSGVAVFLNDGTGTFSPPVTYPVGQPLESLVLGDMDRDGYLDVAVVVGGAEQKVAVLLNNGDGTLSAASVFPVGEVPQRLALGDFDSDGHLDVAVTRFSTQDVAILLNDGTGSLGPAVGYPVASGVLDVVVEDFDRDGRLDLAVSHNRHYSILIGRGDGSFGTGVNVTQAFVPFPGSSVFGDFSEDGRSDWVAQDSSSITTLFNETLAPAGVDCNGNNVIDSCELDGGASDCQADGVLDSCQLAGNDCNNDGVPDDCQLGGNDCNGNGLPDDCETGPDCDSDGTPDECEPDADGDGVPDDCDPCPLDNPDDSDGDGVCDTDDICPGGDDAIDTDGDGVPDFCDPCPEDNPDDSDGDGVCDTDDLCPGGDDNIDNNGNGVPDACDFEPPTLAPAPHDILKNRYISIDPRGAAGLNIGKDLDIRVTLSGSQVNGVTAVGSQWWANEPNAECIAIVRMTRPVTPPNWDACPTLHLTGCPIVPTSSYEIVVMDLSAASDPPLAAVTQEKPGDKWHGDCVGGFTGPEGDPPNVWTAPNGTTNADDFLAAIKTFQDINAFNATHVSVTDMEPNQNGTQINLIVNINDVFSIIRGFQGFEYPGPDLAQCP